jgi:Regulator of chromosome condensation (RCC1) repeat
MPEQSLYRMHRVHGFATGAIAPEAMTLAPGVSPTTISAAGSDGTEGIDQSLAIGFAGYLYAWGNNDSGELGVGTSIGPKFCNQESCSTTPPMAQLLNTTNISAGPFTAWPSAPATFLRQPLKASTLTRDGPAQSHNRRHQPRRCHSCAVQHQEGDDDQE